MLEKIFKVSFLKTTYSVDKVKKVVVCRIDYKIKFNDVRYKLYNYLDLLDGETGYIYGVAKCHDGDTFDTQKGRYIAESRAKKKLYKRIGNSLRDTIKNMEKDLNRVTHTTLLLDKFNRRESEHIEDIINE